MTAFATFFRLLLRLNPARASLPATPATLRGIRPGGAGRVSGFDLPVEQSRRLLEMGLTIGTRLEVVRLAPWGDTIEIEVRGYRLSLRRAEAAGIHVTAEP